VSDNFLDSLREVFAEAESQPIQGHCIQDWRISVFHNQMITLGMKNNQAGSVYTPPAYKKSDSAEILLVWEDGKISSAKVQRPSQEERTDWITELLFWRMAAFEDPYATKIPEPLALPKVEIASHEIRSIIENGEEGQGYLFEQQRNIIIDRPQTAQTSANMMAFWSENSIQTSTGIDVHYGESRYAVSWSFDSLISQGAAKRRLITPEEKQQLWDESMDRYTIINKKAEAIGKDTQVILAPHVVEQMIGQYILANFRGENILEGQSKFIQSDFNQNKKSFESGLSLVIDPLQPLHWSSYLITTEGIPAVRTELVKQGQLHSPYLNVKEAIRWGSAPTAMPAGGGGIKLSHLKQISWSTLLENMQDGILILGVLGLHTQNPVTGSFSLAAPSSLRIKNGRLIGKTDVRISGNFWDILQSPHTAYGITEHNDCPYLLVPCVAENV